MRMRIRKLTEADCERLREIDASQHIGRAWREVEGVRRLVTINYHDPDWPNGYEHHYRNLRQTIGTAGTAFGAFIPQGAGDVLVGIAALNRMAGREKTGEALLDQLFISKGHRSRGIGKKLFQICLEEARGWGMDRIRIHAGSAEETIAFYFALGCREAAVIDREIEGYDPKDFQLQFEIVKE